MLGPIRVGIRFYLPDRRRRDLDNLAKSITDACNKILYEDDSQIVEMHLTKEVDKANPRAEVEVEEIGVVTVNYEAEK